MGYEGHEEALEPSDELRIIRCH